MKSKSISIQNKVNFCLVSREGSGEWLQGIISFIDIESKDVEVFLSDEHIYNSFSPGNKVAIKSLSNRNEFLLSGCINKIASSVHKKALIIKIDDIKEYIDYRKSERYYVNYDAGITSGKGSKSEANILDISLGGVLLISDCALEEGENINVEVFSDPENPILFSGKVIRKQKFKKAYKYGVIIENVEAQSKSLLDALIKLLRAKKTEIEHAWKVFKRVKYALYTISVLLIFLLVFIALTSKGM